MLKKDSIESAIILAKLLRKTGKAIVEPQEGTLLSLVLKESDLLTLGVDYSLTAIEEGEYGDLIDKIYNAHEYKVELSDDRDGIKETEDNFFIHESWMENYSRDIAHSIENNIEFVKLIVIPQIKKVYEELVEIHNGLITEPPQTYFILKDVLVPDFITQECFLELVKEHSDHEAKERVEIDHRLSLNADNQELILEYLHKGANKLGCISDLKDISMNDKVSIVESYLVGCSAEEPLVDGKTLLELLVLVSFFAGIVEDPYFNSGSSSTQNAQWGDYHLHALLNELDFRAKKVTEEIRNGNLISSITPNMNSIYPRPSADGELKEISCYLTNFEGIESPLSPDELIASLCVSNIPLNEVTIDYFTGDNINNLVRAWNYFISNINSRSSEKVKHEFKQKAIEYLQTFHSRETNNRHGIHIELEEYGLKDLSDESIFSLAKTFVVNTLYWNTNAKELIDGLQEGLDDEVGVDLISMSLVVELISNFMLRQAIIVEE